MGGAATLPTGTVTFLMTDVEGSTPLWESDAAAMGQAMARHDELIEREVTASGGVVVKPRGEGDSRFCVFESAPAAVQGALEVQRALTGAHWPTRAPIRVRIGLYSGHAEVRDPDYGEYYGTAPNRCARLRDLGHGGQVLISASAAGLVASELPDKAELVALGSYRLRGIELPEPVHQLAHPDLSAEFPPLRGGAPGNLPEPLTSFVGRTTEISEVSSLLQGHRLVTLTGTAGVGKTRLAIEVGRALRARYPDGVWLVELAPVRDPAGVPRALIGTFGLTEERERSMERILTDYIRDKRLLVVLDNCEHLLEACTNLSGHVLKVSLGCSILVTSREPLGAEGEATWRVPSLLLPDDASREDLAECESVALFCDRARVRGSDFRLDERTAPAVAQICRRLDGIPLAIELAAGKLAVLDAAEIARRIEDRFALLTGGPRTALERQQTMRAAVDWSYSLLSEDERAVLRRLGAFVGGFMLEAAREVCATATTDVDELIASLVRKSLVARDPDQPGRYLLLETIRAYAAEKLADAGEAPEARRDHLRHFCALAAQAAEPLEGGPGQQSWLERLAADHENLQAAVGFAVAADPELGLRLAADIAGYWDIRGYWDLGRRAVETLLEASGDTSTIERARALRAIGRYAIGSGDYETARARYEESLAIARELGDRALIASLVGNLGMVARMEGDYETARARSEESLSLAREVGDGRLIALVIGNLGVVARMQGDYEAARALYEESLAIAREVGDRRQIAYEVGNLGAVARTQGDYETARARYEESLAIARELGDRALIAWGIGNLGIVARTQGDYETARARHEESLAIAHELGERRQIAMVVGNLGAVARMQGDFEAARARYEESLAIAREIGDRALIAYPVGNLGGLAHMQGDYEAARARYEESLAIALELGDRRLIAGIAGNLGAVAQALGDHQAARARYAESLPIARELGDPEITADSLRGCAVLAEATGAHAVACALAAAADAARERFGFRLGGFEQTRFDETVARLREVMTVDAFDAAWARGRAMSLDEAVDLALGIGTGLDPAT